jgi:hypothetical protein
MFCAVAASDIKSVNFNAQHLSSASHRLINDLLS